MPETPGVSGSLIAYFNTDNLQVGSSGPTFSWHNAVASSTIQATRATPQQIGTDASIQSKFLFFRGSSSDFLLLNLDFRDARSVVAGTSYALAVVIRVDVASSSGSPLSSTNTAYSLGILDGAMDVGTSCGVSLGTPGNTHVQVGQWMTFIETFDAGSHSLSLFRDGRQIDSRSTLSAQGCRPQGRSLQLVCFA
ncbi:MAG: hypothetical protein EOO38_12215 [Cytophagaceae bacterium]|nr:MAG: hypothetical protein EOO38_12215 [Cytophagaceae bacterium]